MAPSLSQSALVAGRGPAADYARRLLGDLGVRVRSTDGPADTPAALAWAASGAMALTGRVDRLPRVPAAPLASCALGVARALAALDGPRLRDAPALLGERAALAGLARAGDVAPGGRCRLLRAADGWAALNLARPDDARALPAWLETSPDPGDGDDWGFAARALRTRPLALLARRAHWLGLPFAPAARSCPEVPWLRVARCGPAAPPSGPPRIVDFSSLWAGPLCTGVLASGGARVVKVESRARPDGARVGAPTFFDRLHAGKQSVVVDFGDDRDVALLHALVDDADVVVESARPRALAQLGLDAEAFVAARPGRVWLSITGYGRADAPPGRVAFGDDAAVAAGLAWSAADARGPLFCGDAIADPLTGLHAALAVHALRGSGGGVLLDIALRDVAACAGRFRDEHGGDVEVIDAFPDACVRVAGREAPVAPPRARAWPGAAAAAGTHTEALRSALRIAC